MRYALVAMGCKVSQYEGNALAEFLERRLGLQRAEKPDEADVIVLQTCTVTAKSDREARKIVRHHRRRGPVKIIVTGCYAEREPAALYEAGADLVLGHRTRHRAWRIMQFLTGQSDHRFQDEDWDTFGPVHRAGHRTRVYLKIHDGCDVFCSFCVIPHVRGPGRSLPMEKVLRRIEALRDEGVREIVLTGVNLSSYGRDWGEEDGFLRLCERIAAIPGDFLVRVSSLGAFDGDTRLFDLLCHHPKFAPHFHIPLQSGSPKVLRDMRRPYTLEEFDRVVTHIAAQSDTICLGTDIIVGFPTEGDPEFEETLAYLASRPFAYIHVFSYSPRPGTRAAAFYPPLDSRTVKERSARLRALSREKRAAFIERQLGRTVRALTLHRKDERHIRALTVNYLDIVILDQGQLPENTWVLVRIERRAEKLFGEPVPDQCPVGVRV